MNQVSTKQSKLTLQSISFQAHQSSTTEVPENTLAAMRYAWDLGGIPEIDIRQTSDGVIIGMHDRAPRRTIATAPDDQDIAVENLNFADIECWDAGIKFSGNFRGEKVPALSAVLDEMAKDNRRQLYLDFKDVNLENLAALIKDYGCADKIIFAHTDQNNCITIKKLVPKIRTMLWLPDGGEKDGVQYRFDKVKENNFASLDIVQLHLHDQKTTPFSSWPYAETKEFLTQAITAIEEAQMELEVLLQSLSKRNLQMLLGMGVRRFAVDEPKKFVNMLNEIL